jgi:mRNA interferase MazF
MHDPPLQGAVAVKARPVVVVSSDLFHQTRSDCIVALLASTFRAATSQTDYALQEWAAAGLHQPSTVRSFFNMVQSAQLLVVGRVSDRDGQRSGPASR